MALSFRVRIGLWYIGIVIALLSFSAMLLLYSVGRIATSKFDAALWMLGAAEAEGIAADLQDRSLQQPQRGTITNYHYRQLLGYAKGPLEKYVSIVDTSLTPVDFSSNLTKPLPVDRKLAVRSLSGEAPVTSAFAEGAGALRIVYIPVRGPFNTYPFIVLVGLPESFLGKEIRDFRVLVGSSMLILTLLIGLSSVFLVERCLGPIREVATAAESLSSQRPEGRLPAPSAHDEMGRLVIAFNFLLERLEATLEAQRRFSSRAAHELRTPLTILKGETQIALRSARSPEEYQRVLGSNLEEVEKLNSLIDELLVIARYESGEQEAPSDPVRLEEIVSDVVHDLRSIGMARGVRLLLNLDGEQGLVAGDSRSLYRLIRNIVENGIFYTPRGGAVSVTLLRRCGALGLQIHDTGIGIPTEDLTLIFERFYRSPAARELRPEGSGLGLAMVSVIARLHRATVQVESQVGQGTTFTVLFPEFGQ